MSLNDVRRHHQSSVRSNEDADRGDVAVASPGQETSGPGSAAAHAHAPRGGVRQLEEAGAGRRVGRHGGAGRLHVPLVVAREQQPRQRRVAAGPRTRPPHDRLVLRARQRDVREPQVLAALLVDVLLHGARSTAGLRGRRRSSASRSASWNVTGSVLARDRRRLPEVGVVDDGELEPLAAVHREHLHGLRVALEPAAALLVVVVGASPPAPVRATTRSARWRPSARSSPRRGAARRRAGGRSSAARRRPSRALAPAGPPRA